MTFGPDATYPERVTDPLGQAFEVEYDPRAAEIRRLRDANGQETRYHFDPVGRLTAMVKPGDSDSLPTVQFEHEQQSLPLAVRTRLRQRPGDAATVDTVEYFDGFKQTHQRRSSAEGGQVVVDGFRQYDARGWESVRTATFFSTGFEFVPDEGAADPRRYRFRRNALGRIVETVTPDGRPSRIEYEAARVTAFDVSDTDASPENVARGHFDTPKILEYDGHGHLTAVIEDAGTTTLTTRYGRDAQGRLTTITDARGVETAQYRYDLQGRKIEVRHVDAGRRRVVLNARGDLVLSIDAAGRRVEMQYDALRRITETRVEGVVTERFVYDTGTGANLSGRLARVEDEIGSVSFSYTARGLVAAKRREMTTLAGPAVFSIGFAYDSLDRMTQVVHPGGETVDYHYTPRNLVARIDGFLETIEYNEFGQRVRIRYANGVEQTDTFDRHTFYLSESRIGGPARPEPYYHVGYTYDGAGNPLSIADQVSAAGHPGHQRQFAYDPLFRLTRSEGTLNGTPFLHRFGYDPAGNFRRNEEFAAADLFLGPGGTNQIRGVEQGGLQTPLFDYDANGNVRSTPEASLEFDARGRLRRVVRGDGTVVEFGYDHQGARARKRVTSGGVTLETLYVDGLYEVRGGQVTRFVFHKDTRVAAVQPSGTRFFHHDHLGSVVLVTDAVGAIVQEVAYRTFGSVAFQTAVDAPPFAFLGNEGDMETGFIYCRSRYYDPRLGRFLTPDLFLLLHPETVLNIPCGLNLYSYAGNNPVKLVDKEGSWWKWLVGALVIAALVVATVVVGIATGGAGFAFGILLMASIGSALGAGIGTYSAWRGGGNLEDGFLVGALVGGAAGAGAYALGAAVGAAGAGLGGAWGSILGGAAQGAVLGAANGAIIGYAGGAGDWRDILIQAGVGALVGAVLGGLSGYVSYLSSQGGVLEPGTFQKALGSGAGEGAGAYGQPVQQTYSTGLGPVGQALDTAARPTLNAIIYHTAQPIVYVSLGSVVHAAVYHDWDAIKAWILETFGGEDQEVVVRNPAREWG